MKKTLAVVIPVLLAWLVAAYAMPRLMKIKSPDLYIIFAALALIGILAAAIVIWWKRRESSGTEGAAASAGAAGDELAQLLHDAEGKLASASQIRGKPHFGEFPAVFLMGPQGVTKTTLIVNSGLEAELLAGQVYGESGVAPTPLANLWLARNAIFVETAAAVSADKNRWAALIRRMQPGKLRSAFKGGGQAPRAAVVMLDCEKLFGSGSTQATAALARDLRTQLSEVSIQLGIALPVYVLFTKADRIPFFLDYVHTLQDGEAAQVLGATLPLAGVSGKGVYAEEQSARLNEAFDALYHSLADRRLEVLPRENEAERLPGSYEFPRELRKMRPAITNFLVELCRPSQLNAAPFLRGFYFTGVRPVFVREAMPSVRPSLAPLNPAVAGATGIFRPGMLQDAPVQEVAAKKVPQWVFLRSLFPDVVLADDAALRASGSSVEVSGMRRALLAVGAALCVGLLLAFTISFFKNREMERQLQDASAAIGTAEISQTDLPSLEALRRLDKLRESVATLARYNRDGAPWSYRWGLYTGDRLLAPARKLYFTAFRQLLFGATQAGLLANLKSLHGAPSASDSYEYPYDSLKAYLMTTCCHDKSTAAYLAPVLDKRWQASRTIDNDRVALARLQFDFYADELFHENPYSPAGDKAAVEQARDYLNHFAGDERIYNAMLNEANHGNAPINFNRTFKGSEAVVINRYDVPGAFTKPGYAFMMDAFKHPELFIKGEKWVLGDKPAPALDDPASVAKRLKARYVSEYIGAWREYLRKGSVVSYSSIGDAATKLDKNTAADSPMLGMLCLASVNTGVDSPEVAKAFAPLQKVEQPATCSEQYKGAANQPYMDSLVTLKNALGAVQPGADPTTDPNVAAASTAGSAAKNAVDTLAGNLGIDQEAHIEGQIATFLKEPITYLDPLVKNLAPGALNGKGKGLCSDMRPLFAKYPFDPKANTQATVQDVNSIFKPGDGAFWKFYEANLAKLITKSGDPVAGGGVTLTPGFVRFFRNAAGFSNAAYAGGSGDPKIGFSLKLANGDEIQSVQLNINGAAADLTSSAPGPKPFSWPGSAPGVKLNGKHQQGDSLTYPTYDGLWAAFQFFNEADSVSNAVYEWDLKSGKLNRPIKSASGQPLIIKLELNMGASPPVFQKGYFSSLSCTAEVAKP